MDRQYEREEMQRAIRECEKVSKPYYNLLYKIMSVKMPMKIIINPTDNSFETVWPEDTYIETVIKKKLDELKEHYLGKYIMPK